MRIKLNGQEKDFIDIASLKQVIDQFCRQNQRIIAEVNGEIIRNHSWENTILKNGDKIELVSFVGGG